MLKSWYMDGTFKVTKAPFMQLFTINCFYLQWCSDQAGAPSLRIYVSSLEKGLPCSVPFPLTSYNKLKDTAQGCLQTVVRYVDTMYWFPVVFTQSPAGVSFVKPSDKQRHWGVPQWPQHASCNWEPVFLPVVPITSQGIIPAPSTS